MVVIVAVLVGVIVTVDLGVLQTVFVGGLGRTVFVLVLVLVTVSVSVTVLVFVVVVVPVVDVVFFGRPCASGPEREQGNEKESLVSMMHIHTNTHFKSPTEVIKEIVGFQTYKIMFLRL